MASPRMVEGLAMPREEDEFALSYYNSMTTWIHIDKLLAAFGLARGDLWPTRKSDRRHPRCRGQDADLHHAEGREKTLGPWPGRHLPGRAIRETVGRHDARCRKWNAVTSWCRACADNN